MSCYKWQKALAHVVKRRTKKSIEEGKIKEINNNSSSKERKKQDEEKKEKKNNARKKKKIIVLLILISSQLVCFLRIVDKEFMEHVI